MALKPVSNESLRGRVAASIRESILDGSLPPGAKLTEPELARQLETSRGPIREALRDLEQEGLVRSQAHRSVRVVEITREEVLEVLVPIRLVIEEYAFRRALTHLTASDFETLDSLVAEMEGVAAAGDAEALGDLDVEFHRFVIDRAGQEQCAQIWRSLQPRIRAHFRKEQKTQRLDDVVDEHVLLLDALKAGDDQLVVERVREHVMTFPSHHQGEVPA
ncbi:GntR family transcriptional regulator [Herbiconiux sp. A18JL235]|uniref:GntR family transcriptional regulator n=1 Tax=Herbiconiux sp. A18JL235 TaxID=3152363 RepID=A0AB39BGX3_9MICO